VIVDACEAVPEVDGDSIGDACCHPEHPLLASGAGQVAGVQGGDRGWPVDDRHWLAVDKARGGGDERKHSPLAV
jgi:hypothetical protein